MMTVKKKNKKETDFSSYVINGGRLFWRVILVLVLLCILGIIFLLISKKSFFSSIGRNVKTTVSEAIIGEEGKVTTITESSLEKVFEINELSSIECAYNAVARAFENDGTSPKYYVAYEGTVTAGIDFSKIMISIDDNDKEIILKIPNCEIIDTTVDFGSMDYIFKDNKYNTETLSQEAYKLCEEDLKERAAEETKLLSLAKENAIAAVKALVDPWVKQIDEEYTVNIQ